MEPSTDASEANADMSFDEAYDALEAVPQLAKYAERVAKEDELVDLAGLIGRMGGSSWSVLAQHKREMEAEIASGQSGKRWKATQSNVANRSYNPSAIFASFSKALNMDPMSVVMLLIDSDVIRLDWQWSKLKNLARVRDVTLTIAQHEVTDGEVDDEGRSVHVGEVWRKTSMKYEPVHEG